MRTRLRVIVAALTALVVVGFALSTGSASERETGSAARAAPVLGDYAAPLVGPEGDDGIRHIDTEATIAKLTEAHVNTYAYLIYASPLYGSASDEEITRSQWNDLPGFASAAADAGIDVLVYLVPPSESFVGDSSVPVPDRVPAYKPYDWDYNSWAVQIAELATEHQNIRGIVMDDFGGNTAEWGSEYTFRFSPEYVADMMADAREIAPWLTFSPVIYYSQYWNNTAISSYYRKVVDGVVFPYRAESVGDPNTHDASQADFEGRLVNSMVKCESGDGCLQVSFPPSTPSSAGQYGAASQTIEVQQSDSHELSFRVNDDFIAGQTAGYHFVQALIDGEVVAERDVSTYSGWEQVTVDVTDQLAGKTSAELTLRMYDKQGVSNFHASAWFDGVTGTGFTVDQGGFEKPAMDAWTTDTNGDAFDVARVPSLDYLFMPYASRLGTEGRADPDYRTSADYVDEVLGTALELTDAGLADGALVYVLNLTGEDNGAGDPEAYDRVAAHYAKYSDTQQTDPIGRWQSYFNEPDAANGSEDHTVRDQLVNYIEHAQPGSEIRAHITRLSQAAVVDALVDAHDRGVETWMVHNGDASVHPELRDRLGDRYVHCGTPDVENNSACVSNVPNGTHHMKNWYFSHVVIGDNDYQNMVVASSYNITHNQDSHFNDMLVVSGNQELYDAHVEVFQDYLEQRKTDDRYNEPGGQIFVPSAATYTADFSPQKDGDMAADALARISEFEDGCELRVANLSLNRAPIIDQLVRIRELGCAVRVVTNTPLEPGDEGTLEAADIPIRTADIHNKMMVYEGFYDTPVDEHPTNDRMWVWTGSQNFSTNPLRFRDDVFVGISRKGVYDNYSAHFEKIWTAGG